MITIVLIIVNNKSYGGDCDHLRQVEEERLHNCDDDDVDERIIEGLSEPFFFEADDTEDDFEAWSASI